MAKKPQEEPQWRGLSLCFENQAIKDKIWLLLQCLGFFWERSEYSLDAKTSPIFSPSCGIYQRYIRIYLGYGYPCSLTVKWSHIVFKNSVCTRPFPKVPPICLRWPADRLAGKHKHAGGIKSCCQ